MDSDAGVGPLALRAPTLQLLPCLPADGQLFVQGSVAPPALVLLLDQELATQQDSWKGRPFPLSWKLKCLACSESWIWLAHSREQHPQVSHLLRSCRACSDEARGNNQAFQANWMLFHFAPMGKGGKSKGKSKEGKPKGKDKDKDKDKSKESGKKAEAPPPASEVPKGLGTAPLSPGAGH